MEKELATLKLAEGALAEAVENAKIKLEAKAKTPTTKSAWMWEQELKETEEAVNAAEKFVEDARRALRGI